MCLPSVEGDTHFPEDRPADAGGWFAPRIIPAGEEDSHATRYAVYERAATGA